MKLCKDCKHSWDVEDIAFGECNRGRHVVGQGMLTGRLFYAVKGYGNCLLERHSIFPWHCGKNARYFSAKSTVQQDNFEEKE